MRIPVQLLEIEGNFIYNRKEVLKGEYMMLKDKQNDSKAPLIDLSEIQELKSFDFDHSAGFVCDINTGICGPVIQEEEGKK